MNLKILRKLAKSNRFQALYRRSKDSQIRLFNNNYDLTKIQEWFLYYLEIYDMLYKDLARKEPYISQEVIDSDIRAEAYLLWKSLDMPDKKENKKPNKREAITSSNIPSMIFRRGNK